MPVQRDEGQAVISQQEIDWNSIDWKRAYGESRTIRSSHWFPIAIIFAVLAILSIWSGWLFLPVLFAIAAAGTALLAAREALGDRLVLEAEVHGKRSYDSSDGPQYILKVLIQKKFTLKPGGELQPRRIVSEKLRSVSVRSSIYDRYDKGDTVVLLCLPGGRVLNDLPVDVHRET